jgi:hypothetical protein
MTYLVDKLCASSHHFRHKSVLCFTEAVESLAERQTTHNIVTQVCVPMIHIFRYGPTVFPSVSFTKTFGPNSDVLHYQWFY